MSVKQCDRRDCEEVMCDRMSRDAKWYICDKCFDELVAGGIGQNIQEFMSFPRQPKFEGISPYEYFDKIFPTQRGI